MRKVFTFNLANMIIMLHIVANIVNKAEATNNKPPFTPPPYKSNKKYLYYP